MARPITIVAADETRWPEQAGRDVTSVRCTDFDNRANGNGRSETNRVPDGPRNDLLRIIPTETFVVTNDIDFATSLFETRCQISVTGKIIDKHGRWADDLDEYQLVTRHVLR